MHCATELTPFIHSFTPITDHE